MIAYVDIISGISGDMLLGALIDVGFPVDKLKNELDKLGIDYEIEIKKERDVVEATSVYVHSTDKKERRLKDIFEIIEKSDLKEEIKGKAKEMFLKLAEAEAKIHGVSKEEIIFHELGAVDTIIDIVGCLIAIDGLKIKKIYSSPVKVGRGFVTCMHGLLPAPAPATVEFLKNKPVEFTQINEEITTPTGAVLLSMAEFSQPEMEVKAVGYGKGKKKLNVPNILRIFIGNEIDAGGIYVIETNIDDMNPEFYPHVIEKLQKVAIDAYIVPVIMKKGRYGTLLKVLVNAERLEEAKNTIFRETTTFGIRYYKVRRERLKRDMVDVETEYGKIRVKIGYLNGEVTSISPEYEDCKKIADALNKPIKEIYEKAKRKAIEKLK